MKTSELLDKALQMLVDTKLSYPCAYMADDEQFCKDFCKAEFNGPQKECWLHYIEWKENR